MKVREATPADATFLWEVTNSAREWFFSTERISWDDHVRWLTEVLVDPSRTLLVGVSHDDVRIGSVRLDRDSRQVRVSIAVAQQYRGQGLGRQLLDSAIAFYGSARFVAEVRADNAASLRLFSHWDQIEVAGDRTVFAIDGL